VEENKVVAEAKPVMAPRLSSKAAGAAKRARRKKGWSWDALERISADPGIGLNDEQVSARTLGGFVNVTVNKNKKTYLGIVIQNVCTFFNLLCFFVAGALIAVGAAANLFFLLIICSNMVIGIVQEFRAKRKIDKISLITAPTATVIRNGVKTVVAVNQLVVDDIVLFTHGNQISADCVVVSGELEANESLLTGEPNAIKKKTGDMLYGGSFVSSGNCVARVEKVASACYSVSLAEKAKRYAKAKSELMYSLRLIIKVIGALVIPLGVVMFYINYTFLPSTSDVVVKTAGAIIGMIPAGMFLLTSVALAVGAVKLANKRAYVQDLYGIEMLARVNMLCLDKTGTLTDGTMKVTSVVKLNNSYNEEKFKTVFGSILKALDNKNQTSQALELHFGVNTRYPATKKIPFSSERKYSAVTLKEAGTYAFGAPDFLLKEDDIAINKLVKEYSAQGQRVLLVTHSAAAISGEKLPASMKPVALIVIQDHIREDAPATIKWFVGNDVKVRIISGDNPITVSEVSRRCGVPDADKYISLAGLSDQQVIDAADKYTVFGRVSPEQKAVLVRALKASNYKVAMTGDGVNDILALKDADCSIAMASGSEAARNVSHLVLMDSNFQSLPSVVAEGRRVVNNITKSSSLFLMKTIFIMSLVGFVIISQFSGDRGISFPFAPNHLMLLEIFAIGIPSFFLALQPSSVPIKGKFLATIFKNALPGGAIFFLAFLGCFLFDIYLGTGWQYETMGSYAVAFTGLIMLLAICRPLDMFRGILFCSMALGCTIALLSIPQDFFGYVPLGQPAILFTIIMVQFSFLYLVFKKPMHTRNEAPPNLPQQPNIKA